MKKKIIIAVLCLSVLGIGFGSSSARAMSISDIQALIQKLENMVIQLQQQLMAIKGNVSPSSVMSSKLCLTSNNLSYGMTNDNVKILQEGLKRDPSVFSPYKGEPAVSTGHFGPRTRAAVIAFQSKYGLPIKGYADLATKNKFNQLYCYNTTSQSSCDSLCKTKGYKRGSCDCALGDYLTPSPIDIGWTSDCACSAYEKQLQEKGIGTKCGHCCCRN